MKWGLNNVVLRRSGGSVFLIIFFLGTFFLGGVALGVLLDEVRFVERAKVKLLTLSRKFRATEEPGNTKTIKFEPAESVLNTLEIATVPLGPFRGGGAVVTLHDKIIFIAAKGQIGFLHKSDSGENYAIQYIRTKVPLNFDGLKRSAFVGDPYSEYEFHWFRVVGALIVEKDGVYYLYVSHHRFRETCAEQVLSRAAIVESGGSFDIADGSWETVFTADPCIELVHGSGEFPEGQQAGGRLARLSADRILMTVGDSEYDGYMKQKTVSMDTGTVFGKAIEIDINSKAFTLFSIGLRNPQGLLISKNGTIWETEHGPQGGDELNILERGGNFGWPEVSYGIPYDFPTRPWPPTGLAGRHDEFVKPVFAFLPSIGISNLAETDSDEFPLWRGDLLVGSLRDQSMWRLRVDDRRIAYSERIYLGDAVRDIHELPSGEIAVLTDSGSLKIVRRKLRKGEPPKAQTLEVRGYDAIADVFAMRRN